MWLNFRYILAAILLDLNEDNLGHSLISSKRNIRGEIVIANT